MNPSTNKIIVGTAQFGMDYGVSNTQGKTDKLEVDRILDYLNSSGVKYLDTAPVYGDSHRVISNYLKKNNVFKVNTKISSINKSDTKSVIKEIHQSLKLFDDNISCLSFHDANDFTNENYYEVIEEVEYLKRKGYINKVGLSIYDESQLENVIDKMDIDIVQVPFNIYDQRLINSKKIFDLSCRGAEIHARSIFLQGLILMGLEQIPERLNSIKTHQEGLIQYSRGLNKTVYDLCLAWVFKQDWIDKIVVGLNDLSQSKKLIKSISGSVTNDLDLEKYSISDPLIINPVNW